jgi:hypothetical protein
MITKKLVDFANRDSDDDEQGSPSSREPTEVVKSESSDKGGKEFQEKNNQINPSADIRPAGVSPE